MFHLHQSGFVQYFENPEFDEWNGVGWYLYDPGQRKWNRGPYTENEVVKAKDELIRMYNLSR